jgi:hypothetical protein
MTPPRFDDADAISALVSDEFGDWGPKVDVTQSVIDAFADLTGDHQWIHVDVERSRDGPFGGTIAHGFLTLSLLPKLLDGTLPVSGFADAVNYGAESLRFVAPVPAGSSIHARSRVVGGEVKRSGTRVRTEVAIHVVGVDRPSVMYTMITLFRG